MADSTPTVSTEVATDREPVATDEIDGKHHQKVKLEFGGDDVATSVSELDPLPVMDFTTQATLAAVVAKLIAAPATEAKQDSEIVQLEAVRDRLPESLDADGSMKVADVFTAGQTLASQAGAGAVLTFTFTSPVDLVWVRSVGEAGYADPFGGTPADGTGIYLADDEPAPITVRTSSVKVWAPTGATVHCWGYGG